MTRERWNNSNHPNSAAASVGRYNINNLSVMKRNNIVNLLVIIIMSHYCLDVANGFGSFLTTTVSKNKIICCRQRWNRSQRGLVVFPTLSLASHLNKKVQQRQQRHLYSVNDEVNNKNNNESSSSATTTTTTTNTNTNNKNSNDILEEENRKLRVEIQLLKDENERLEKQHYQQQIVIETFEGEGLPTFDDTGNVIPKWYKEGEEEDYANTDEIVKKMMKDSNDECFLDTSTPSRSRNENNNDDDFNACPVEPDVTFKDALRDRAYWLVGLLILQSCSGLILSRNEMLLQKHPVIVYFLTMLVGAGGNAGNQASVRVIRGLALGRLDEPFQKNRFLNREFKMALVLSLVISIAGFCRASIFRTPLAETVAVTAALALIVFSSICLGAVLPLLLKRLGVDPAHSSTSIQVVMDILGVLLTVLVSTAILDSQWGAAVVARLGGAPA